MRAFSHLQDPLEGTTERSKQVALGGIQARVLAAFLVAYSGSVMAL